MGETKGKGPEFLEYSVSSSPFFFSHAKGKINLLYFDLNVLQSN